MVETCLANVYVGIAEDAARVRKGNLAMGHVRWSLGTMARVAVHGVRRGRNRATS